MSAPMVSIEPRNVRFAGGARPAYIKPNQLMLKLDHEVVKMVPVKVDFQGTLPPGSEVSGSISAPAAVRLTGPRQRIRDIEIVRTEAIDLEGRQQSFRKSKVKLLPPGENWLARLDPDSVMVDVTILARSTTRDFTNLPVRVLNSPANPLRARRLEPTEVNVRVKGPIELIESLNRDKVQPYVDCATLTSGGEYELPVRLSSPDGVSAGEIEPAAVTADLAE